MGLKKTVASTKTRVLKQKRSKSQIQYLNILDPLSRAIESAQVIELSAFDPWWTSLCCQNIRHRSRHSKTDDVWWFDIYDEYLGNIDKSFWPHCFQLEFWGIIFELREKKNKIGGAGDQKFCRPLPHTLHSRSYGLFRWVFATPGALIVCSLHSGHLNHDAHICCSSYTKLRLVRDLWQWHM